MRVVFLDALTFGDVSLERFTTGWECAVHRFTSPQELPQRLKGFPVAVVNKVEFDRKLLASQAAGELRLIAIAATGTDNIDLAAARERGVAVCNVPGYAAQSVAQFTLALILELATQIGRYLELVRAGGWQQSPIYTRLDFPIFELYGKKLGIIGYGNIGRRVAEMARGFGMEVMISARPASQGAIPEGRLGFEELLASADFLSLHCPLTPETTNLIDGRALSLMKPTAFLINTARGGLVDAQALIRALRAGRLAGAALDVLAEEPPPASHPILAAAKELNNLLVTPHCAWSAREARERLMEEVRANILAFFKGEKRNRVV